MDSEILITKLSSFYSDNSKHANYQNIPEFVRDAINYREIINEEWRGDTARYKYILEELVELGSLSICDVGANTGFFSLSLAHRFSSANVFAFEGNRNHTEFMKIIKEAFSITNIEIENYYIDYDGIEILGQYDVLLNLNVLHHAGIDFDKDKTGYEELDRYLVEYLQKLLPKTKRIIFQMGYNWGGNKSKPIVELNDDLGKILFTTKTFNKAGWGLKKIAHITKNKSFAYVNYPEEITRMIAMGTINQDIKEYISKLELNKFSEFYRRPIFLFDRHKS